MDEILYLEPDEEITSVVDKLRKTESASIGLVIPRNSTLIHSIINLKLLKKEAVKHDKVIALITSDKIGRNIASQVGLEVFEDVHAKRPVNPIRQPDWPSGDEVIEVDMSDREEADGLQVKHYNAQPTLEATKFAAEPSASPHAAHATRPEPETHQPQFQDHSQSEPSSRKRAGLVAGLLFIATVGGTVIGLPQTAITVTLATEPFEKTIPLTISKDAKAVDETNNLLPGRFLEVTNSDARRIAATGKKDVGGKAKGSVVISNAWDAQPIKLTAGTNLTTPDGKVFALTSDSLVPGATVALKEGALVTTPGTTNAIIEASQPGESFNVKATTFVISGLSAKQSEKIIGQSNNPLSGGFTKQVTVMTQADIDAAKAAILLDLNKDGLAELTKQAKNQKLINEAVNHELVSVETSPAKPDTETDNFDITVKTKHQAMVFDEPVVQSLVNKLIGSEVPNGKELLLSESDEFVVSVTDTDYPNGKLNLESRIKTKVGTHLDPIAAKAGLVGKNEVAIRQQLATIPNIKDVTLVKFPRWWWQDTSYLPYNTRLKVVYE